MLLLFKRLGAWGKAKAQRDDPAPPPGQPADTQYATIHKGAYVEVRLYIEGDEPPAHDFAQTAREAAERVVQAGIAAAAPLRISVKRIAVDDDPPDVDEQG